MEPFLISTGIVALAEIGDKTQLLALLLAVRFKKPWPIVSGIFVATILNHALAGALGASITTLISRQTLRWMQVATVMLAARFDAYVAVVAGTTLGMMLANVSVVLLGERMTRREPLRLVHMVSAIVFLGLGLFALTGDGVKYDVQQCHV